MDPPEYAALAQHWVRDLGATLVGGCCGIGPEHISALRDALQPELPAEP
jgi:methionine synthase I (cobalamin-dependent)